MKKYILSLALIVIFAFYAMLSNQNSVAITGNVPDTALSDNNQNVTQVKSTSTIGLVINDAPANTPKKTVPIPVATPAPATTALYRNGSYTGDSADAYYGQVQVTAIISGGKLTEVKVPVYPSDRGTSIRINGRAVPLLVQEAISAQSAKVDAVSGATETSQGFRASLASALIKAKK